MSCSSRTLYVGNFSWIVKFHNLFLSSKKKNQLMGKNSEPNASFYKLLIDHDFTSQLRLPPQFVTNHGENLSEKVQFFTESGEYSWIVKTEQIGDHRFFTDGWSRFAEDADLKSREFLIFNLIGKSKFEVSIYDTSGCLKELDSDFDDRVPGDVNKWSFVKKLTKEDTSELEIPRDFAEGTGIVKNRKLELRSYEKWKKWPIHVSAKKCGKLAISGGWNDFLRGNKVLVGTTLSFEFVSSTSGNIIKAKVLKKGSNGKLFSSAKRGRGRPLKFHGFD